MPTLKILNSQDDNFASQLKDLLAFETVTDSTLIATVNDIIATVREDGDDAVLKLTQEFDKHPA